MIVKSDKYDMHDNLKSNKKEKYSSSRRKERNDIRSSSHGSRSRTPRRD